MSKTKTPFLSMDAHGSIGKSITAQKLHSSSLVRTMPVPTDPYSLPQAYQRWTYQDALYAWSILTNIQKAIYRSTGARYHLTAMQYFIKVYLNTLPGLKAWYRFDFLSGSSVIDSSPAKASATIYGASITNGAINHGLYFDGLNDYGNQNNPALPSGNSPRTLEILAVPERINSGDTLVSYGQQIVNQGFGIAIGGNSSGDIYIDTWGYGWYSAGGKITANVINHIAITYNGTIPYLFVNGIKYSMTPNGSPAPNTALTRLRFGTLLTLGSYWYRGIEDNFIAWDYVLDDALILAHSKRRYPAQ